MTNCIIVEFYPFVGGWITYDPSIVSIERRVIHSFGCVVTTIGPTGNLAEHLRKTMLYAAELSQVKIVVLARAWSPLLDVHRTFGEDQYLIINDEADAIEAILRFG